MNSQLLEVRPVIESSLGGSRLRLVCDASGFHSLAREIICQQTWRHDRHPANNRLPFMTVQPDLRKIKLAYRSPGFLLVVNKHAVRWSFTKRAAEICQLGP